MVEGFVKIGEVDDFPVRSMRRVQVDDRTIVVTNLTVKCMLFPILALIEEARLMRENLMVTQ
jgi:hypothetical protein